MNYAMLKTPHRLAMKMSRSIRVAKAARANVFLRLSTHMAGVQLDLVMMQRDIRVNNNDLAGLSDTINTLRSEIREVRQRLDKYDENVNLRSSVFTQTECFKFHRSFFQITVRQFALIIRPKRQR